MKIGTPKEIKNREARVGLTPHGAHELVEAGHDVFVETGAGSAIGFADADYQEHGCTIVDSADALFSAAELIIKVKEPQPEEVSRLRPEHTLFTYLHLAAAPDLAHGLADSGATCIAYETVTDPQGHLPLLTPMSEVAGRLSIQAGTHYLELLHGGPGLLLGGVTGVPPARVTIIGGGVAGLNAAEMAVGLGADVTILDRSTNRLRELDTHFKARARTLFSTPKAIERHVIDSDLVVGAVLLPGAAAPKLVRNEHVEAMRPGSVMVDIAIDQGGCFETSRPTTHDDPVYQVSGVTHYCVTNMPAAVARTSTEALANATLPYILKLARLGTDGALKADPHLAEGLNVKAGEIVHPEVRASLQQAA